MLMPQYAFTKHAHTLPLHSQTCEIAGDDSSPHASIGSARWMPVGKAGMQAQILREAVENQTPDVIICDEISTRSVAGCMVYAWDRGCPDISSSYHHPVLPPGNLCILNYQ